jgi:hypothetical protein
VKQPDVGFDKFWCLNPSGDYTLKIMLEDVSESKTRAGSPLKSRLKCRIRETRRDPTHLINCPEYYVVCISPMNQIITCKIMLRSLYPESATLY